MLAIVYLSVLSVLTVISAALAYKFGRNAKYIAVQTGRRRVRVMTCYKVWHVVCIVVYSACVAYLTLLMIKEFSFEWAATIPSNKSLGDLIVRTLIASSVMFAGGFFVSCCFSAGNKKTQEHDMRQGIKPVVLDDFRLRTAMFVFLSPNIKKAIWAARYHW
ncbi:MAG: hypothetical protein LBU20_01325 [Candidatus Nomurabacteria bacterium]|jgi:hypothetical protein|nr:hypothetical protein [Candidatus Nomurabacteria bacterium]